MSCPDLKGDFQVKKYRISFYINFYKLFFYVFVFGILLFAFNFIDVYLNCEYGWKNYYLTFFSPGRENFRRGYTLKKEGNFNSAKEEFLKAIQKDDKLFGAYLFLGEICYKSGSNKEAIFYLNKAKEIDKVKKIYVILGNIYLEEKKYNDAISILEEGKKVIFPDAEILYLLGYAYEKNEEPAHALQVYDSCVTKFYPRHEFGKLCKAREDIVKKIHF